MVLSCRVWDLVIHVQTWGHMWGGGRLAEGEENKESTEGVREGGWYERYDDGKHILYTNK